MKKYRKPIVREIVLDAEIEILAGSVEEKHFFNTGTLTSEQGMYSDKEDLSKGNSWDSWE